MFDSDIRRNELFSQKASYPYFHSNVIMPNHPQLPPASVRRLSFRTKRYLFNVSVLQSRTRQNSPETTRQQRCRSAVPVRKNSSNLLQDEFKEHDIPWDKIEHVPEIITFSSVNVTFSYSED